MSRHVHIHVHTKDADPDAGPKFSEAVKRINQDLTTASRGAESLVGTGLPPDLKAKAQKLESLIDAARTYAFQIR